MTPNTPSSSDVEPSPTARIRRQGLSVRPSRTRGDSPLQTLEPVIRPGTQIEGKAGDIVRQKLEQVGPRLRSRRPIEFDAVEGGHDLDRRPRSDQIDRPALQRAIPEMIQPKPEARAKRRIVEIGGRRMNEIERGLRGRAPRLRRRRRGFERRRQSDAELIAQRLIGQSQRRDVDPRRLVRENRGPDPPTPPGRLYRWPAICSAPRAAVRGPIGSTRIRSRRHCRADPFPDRDAGARFRFRQRRSRRW